MKRLKFFSVRLTKRQAAAVEKELAPLRGGDKRFSVIAQTRTGSLLEDDVQFLVVDEEAGHAINKLLHRIGRLP